MKATSQFKVTVTKEEVVTAAVSLPEHWLPVSNLDLIVPQEDVGVFFCYQSPTLAFGAMVDVLKRAMAQTLVSYYAFASELAFNSLGEPELRCNNRGVDFLEASADVQLLDLDLHHPDDSVKDKLVPNKKRGVLAVQATQLKCGGLVVACSFDHRAADAYSANMFLVSWAEMAQSKPLSFTPSYRRSLLHSRRPVLVDTSLDGMYVPISKLPPPKSRASDDHLLIGRIYHVTAEQVERLQSLASSGGCRRTKLESFSAFLWKVIAMSAVNNKEVAKLGIVVDGRTRLSGGEEKKAANLANYFGNVISGPFRTMNVLELTEKPLSWVADEIHEFLERMATKEHFLGLIDWIEFHRPDPTPPNIYCRGAEGGPAVVVSSGLRFPVAKVDFGWGKPAFGSYYFPWVGDSGYVMPMPSPAGNGDWVVYMHLFKREVDVIEAAPAAAGVLKPFANHHLNVLVTTD